MAEHLEQERKYLLSEMPGLTEEVLGIFQYYTDDGMRYRAQTDIRTNITMFIQTRKTFVSKGVNKEDEVEVPAIVFYYCMKDAVKALHKVRHIFRNREYKFEVDVFNNTNIILMEVEVQDMEKEIVFPTYIKDVIIREVTGDRVFNSAKLATKIKTKK